MKKADVVIITALKEESDAVKTYLNKFDEPIQEQVETVPVYRYNLNCNDSNSSYQVVLYCINNMGSYHAGINTGSAILSLNP
ncbi:MAG: hypothetical protein KAG43_09885, partial [Candidatus Marithrix sp.]|nr:hypothetical protein [Candidatus Marithrix sp.]